MIKTNEAKYLDIGIIVSARFLCEAYDMPSIAANLLAGYGISKKRIQQIADTSDKKVLIPLYKTERVLEVLK